MKLDECMAFTMSKRTIWNMTICVAGLGYIIMDGTNFFRIHEVYCVVILLGVLGYGMDRVIVVVGNRIIHWQGK